ncbi:hypothetical protein TNCT_222811 [Trichonephila clavata]|uniref:Uncharacterized protein n=1 Tax=Trichonephila clavata TaxID=2740835 RepID=A0A8X6HGA0_TRICU|nr:hypothetical protein TNCT_222811 [Trichonephila clavata]
MAEGLYAVFVRLVLTPLTWVLQMMIMITGIYLANLIKLFFYLEHVLNNLNQIKISRNKIKLKSKSVKNSLKYLQRIVQYHRKKHLKLRNKFKFQPTLPTIEEIDETDQTICNSPNLSPSTEPPNDIPECTGHNSNNSAISKPTSIPPIRLNQNFSNYSFLIPDFIVPTESTPSNFNTNFATEFNNYIQHKNKRKPFQYIKRKFKTFKKKLLKK